MNKETMWKIFEATGNVDAYLLYKNIERSESSLSGASQTSGEMTNASVDGRNSYQTTEYWRGR